MQLKKNNKFWRSFCSFFFFFSVSCASSLCSLILPSSLFSQFSVLSVLSILPSSLSSNWVLPYSQLFSRPLYSHLFSCLLCSHLFSCLLCSHFHPSGRWKTLKCWNGSAETEVRKPKYGSHALVVPRWCYLSLTDKPFLEEGPSVQTEIQVKPWKPCFFFSQSIIHNRLA